MEKLVRGVAAFQNQHQSSFQALFEELAHGQAPEALFITCSDSRLNPNLLTQTHPGELFILRNAGNIVPPYGASRGGEEATIEYAVTALGVKDIIVCGHSLCGAMGGLLYPEHLKDMPALAEWLGHAEATRRIMAQGYPDLAGDHLLTATVEENVLVQLDHLRTHPCVAVKLARGELRIHGWVYELETGEVYAFEPSKNQFVPLRQATLAPAISRKLTRQALQI